MYVGYFYAVRGAMGQAQRMDIISSNMANASTPGFKKDRTTFEDYLIEIVKADQAQGPIRQTDRDLDVALKGPGYIKVQTPTGVAYTRDGSFHIDRAGNLLTAEGHPVLGDGGPINLGEETSEPITINSRGGIMRGQEQIATLALVDLKDKTYLQNQGGSLVVWAGAGQPEEVQALETEVLQDHLEMANVHVVSEMVDMIDAYRSFESYIKAIQSFHEIDTKAVNQVGRLR